MKTKNQYVLLIIYVLQVPGEFPLIQLIQIEEDFSPKAAHGIDLVSNSTTPSSTNKVECIENGRFYRNPDRPIHKLWTLDVCSRYYLCLDNELFNFQCSIGLLFDVNRQICDFKFNVDNCDVTAPNDQAPKPLLDQIECNREQLGCGDGTCLPQEYFCDGSSDCQDGSDENQCDSEVQDLNNGFVEECDPENCSLPDCFCSLDGTEIPGGLKQEQVPQMILLSFNDAINEDNWDLYNDILAEQKLTNPNGCPIQATFFISHQYNNYYYTQKIWGKNHEIAIHSITHRGPKEWWTTNATIEDWFDEMIGQANILHRYSSVPLDQMKGMRVPFLRIGWNRQFLMMKEFGFLYDSSMVVEPVSKTPLWPFTLDYRVQGACSGQQGRCPTRSYPGIWEMVLNQLHLNASNSTYCSTLESCPIPSNNDDLVYRFLMHNFHRHYTTNRAPLHLVFHSKWLKNRWNRDGFQRFMETMQQKNDVWFVTYSEAIKWLRNPTSNEHISDFEGWQCQISSNEKGQCNETNTCVVYSRIFQQNRVFHTCSQCPERYPWIRNEFGSN